MIDLRKRFIKCDNGEYHELNAEDIRYMAAYNKLPEGYQEVDLEHEVSLGRFCTMRNFLGVKPTPEQAKNAAIIAGRIGVPIVKKAVNTQEFQAVNYYPIYWLKEYFGTK